MSSEDLHDIFNQHASFGGSHTSLNSGNSETLLDNAKFAKLCRDSKIINKSCTTTDVDIIFNKVKNKGERKISFEKFKQALRELAPKRFPNESEEGAYNKIFALVAKNGQPSASGTVPKAEGIFNKLTDASQYTGTHKLQYDSEGRGHSLNSQDYGIDQPDLKNMVSRGEKRHVTSSMDNLHSKPPAKKASERSTEKLADKRRDNDRNTDRNTDSKPQANSKKATTGRSNSNLSGSRDKVGSKDSVYDRLTDTKGYTGSHKHRFDETGRGKGLAGRDSGPAKKDLSQIVSRD